MVKRNNHLKKNGAHFVSLSNKIIPSPKSSNSHLNSAIKFLRLSESKRSQITIFIILGLVLIVGFMIVFLLINPPEVKVIDEKNPQAFIESCTEGAVEEAIDTLSKKGGDISPKGYISYNGTEITYLCYNENIYDPCINQRPLLIEHIEKEITNYITPIVTECFNDLENKLRDNYDVESSGLKVETRLQSKNIAVKINRNIKITREGEVREFNEFRMHLISPIYDFAKIAMEIANQESRFCNFDELGFMIFYPNFDVTKFITGDADIIYVIKEVSTDQKFTFAVRSCTLPPGY